MILRLRSDALDWIEAGEEVVALDNREAVYLSTNTSGAFLWQKLSSGSTRDELVHELAERFAIDDDQAGRDVDAFLGQLSEAGLLGESP